MRTVLRAMTLAVGFLSLADAAQAATNDTVRDVLTRRFEGDRTGACVAAAVVEPSGVSTAYFCANPQTARPFDEHTAFEIGSVSKTMTAALLADLILKGELSLDDPLAKLLPPGMRVPTFGGEPVLLRHVVTHTSGLPALPSRMAPGDPSNPYARLSESDLLASLAEAKLSSKPGSTWAYSNFAMMVLSYGLAKRSGKDFEALLSEKLFGPLGMSESYVGRKPAAVRAAGGHMANGKSTSAWDFQVNMAGVGGVRSTLPDMVRYVRAQLRPGPDATGRAIALTQREITKASGITMGMNWLVAPMDGRALLQHEGGTGGFSSVVVVDPQAGRGVVMLADAQLSDLGGLGAVAVHLLNAKVPLGTPHRVAVADGALLDALAGRYKLDGVLGMTLRRRGNALTIQADGQGEVAMGYDSAGDFYGLEFDALLRPVRRADGAYDFSWHQGGGESKGVRVDAAASAPAFKPSVEELKAYEGTYQLAPSFAITVFVMDGRLFTQGTGQQAIAIEPVAKDTFVAQSVGAEIVFERNADGKVVALILKQRGQVIRGAKQ